MKSLIFVFIITISISSISANGGSFGGGGGGVKPEQRRVFILMQESLNTNEPLILNTDLSLSGVGGGTKPMTRGRVHQPFNVHSENESGVGGTLGSNEDSKVHKYIDLKDITEFTLKDGSVIRVDELLE